ncbi:MAG: hypothetical protein E6Q97_30085 [Desulfurellales bacterium]|nr:MAG: hypothetical protein E6Q97_30085 [Desulfurellales bacterium]
MSVGYVDSGRATQTTAQPIVVDSFAAAEAAIREMIEPIRNPQLSPEEWQSTIEEIQRQHGEYFDRQAGPDGAWAPLSPLTVAKKGHNKILYEQSILQDSLQHSGAMHSIREPNPTELVYGTDRPWAWVHQEGAGLPQRQHVGLTEEGTDAVAETVADAVVQMLFG